MSETSRPRPILRRIGVVLAGLLVVVVPSIGTDVLMHAIGIHPPWGEPMSDALFVLATAYRIAYGIAGSYIAARLAPDRPMAHAMSLGFIGVALGVVGALATWNAGPEFGPRWYPIAIFAIPLPCAWIGGKLHRPRATA